MKVEDIAKPAGLIVGLAALAAAGFAAGYVVARDPKVLRRFAVAAAGGIERVSAALAETREEVADLWAAAREDARAAAEDAAFAEPAAAAATAAVEVRETKGETEKPAGRRAPRRRRTP